MEGLALLMAKSDEGCPVRRVEAGASDATLMAAAGLIDRSMLEHYSHVRMPVKPIYVTRPPVAGWPSFYFMIFNGRGGRIRTCELPVPNHAHGGS